MFTSAAAVLGLTLAQPPAAAPDNLYPFNTRAITIPIDYRQDPKDIRRVELWACANGDGVWKPVATAPPTKPEFNFTAPDDGLYWFQIQIVDLKGRRDPPDVTAEPPAMKVLIDTKLPRVGFTAARREGEHVVVEWKVDDKNPDDEKTAVQFRAGGPDAPWQDVTLPPGPRTGVRFPPGVAGPVTVRVTVADRAGNPGEAATEVGGPGAGARVAVAPPAAVVTPAGGVGPPAGGLPPPGSITPTEPSGPGPLAPAAPPVQAYQPPTQPYQPSAVAAAPPATAAPLPVAGVPAAVPAFDPKATAPPPPAYPATAAYGGLTPGTPAPAAPAADAPPVRVVNTPRFPINYNVEQQGGSKIGRIDLYVTRDDGRSWRKWSQHPGGEGVVLVNLAVADNAQPEGPYGFRLVSVSGAGLSDDPPNPGDAPDLRVVVDLTKPAVTIRAPSADPADPGVLVLNWVATDANFGDDPITLEWAEGPSGPWRPVVTGPDGPVQQAGAVAAARRVANTGQYGWRVPPGMPPRVHLKVTARDAAGNTTEWVTRDPILIDLTKPKVRITGVGGR